jgi:molybdopterin-synthase adenylyltransferase
MLNRFTRQADLVPQTRLEGMTIDVIGVGAIGRQVALQLAALGALNLRLFDPDSVELTNVTTQGYHQTEDLGQPKVEAMRRTLLAIEPVIRVEMICDRFRPTARLRSCSAALTRSRHGKQSGVPSATNAHSGATAGCSERWPGF